MSYWPHNLKLSPWNLNISHITDGFPINQGLLAMNDCSIFCKMEDFWFTKHLYCFILVVCFQSYLHWSIVRDDPFITCISPTMHWGILRSISCFDAWNVKYDAWFWLRHITHLQLHVKHSLKKKLSKTIEKGALI